MVTNTKYRNFNLFAKAGDNSAMEWIEAFWHVEETVSYTHLDVYKRQGIFRRALKQMFIWRLKMERPPVINLTLDTMVMDNDEAEKRHGVQPTYKKVKGFQPVSYTHLILPLTAILMESFPLKIYSHSCVVD